MTSSMRIGWPLAILMTLSVQAQQVSPAKESPKSFTGCVTPLKGNPAELVLSSGDRCSVLDGVPAATRAKLPGHTVELDGVLIPPKSPDPELLRVTTIKRIGASCTDTCQPEPPGSRGLGSRKKKQGSGGEAGTPGVQSNPKPDDPH